MIYAIETNRVRRPALLRGGRFVLADPDRGERLAETEAEAARLIREEGCALRVEVPGTARGRVIRRALASDDDVLTRPDGSVPIPGAPC